MLSERATGSLECFVKIVQESKLMDKVQELGPVKVLDVILNQNARIHPDIDRELIANREEAEKYLGALLGMM